MPRVKVPRKSTAIDMTAMCDVAFLLLTFFILTAKPRVQELVPVDPPRSSAEKIVPDEDIATLVIGKGEVFFSVAGFETRKQTLTEMGKLYNISFTPAETDRFAVTNSFGVPINQLKQLLNLEGAEEVKKYQQNGIPLDSVGKSPSELYNWIHTARVVTKNLHNKEMRVTLKGDAKEEYPTIQKIIAVLQKQKLNRFSLITSAAGGSGGAKK